MRARYYDAVKQRLISEDPFDFLGGGTNLFEYAGTNPVSNRDPVGLTCQTNWEFLKEWFFGAGARNRDYGPGDIELFEMQVSLAMAKIRERYAQGRCQANATINSGSFEAAWNTILNSWTIDFGSTALQVGGFNIDIQRNADGTLTDVLKNIAGTKSWFYHLVPDRTSETGWLRSITQNFTWTESSSCFKGCK